MRCEAGSTPGRAARSCATTAHGAIGPVNRSPVIDPPSPTPLPTRHHWNRSRRAKRSRSTTALIFERSSEWDRQTGWLHRGVKPSDLGVGGRLLFVVAGAFLVAAAFVLVAASGNVLIDLLS